MNCTWSSWGNYSACPVTCGGGTQTRTRTKLVVEKNGGICSGLSYQERQCNTEPCPGILHTKSLYISYVLSNWSKILCQPIILIDFSWAKSGKCFIMVKTCLFYDLPYAHHHNPLLIINCSWILTIYKVRILQKSSFKKRFWPSKMG